MCIVMSVELHTCSYRTCDELYLSHTIGAVRRSSQCVLWAQPLCSCPVVPAGAGLLLGRPPLQRAAVHPGWCACTGLSAAAGGTACGWSLHVMTCLHHPSPWQLISHVLHHDSTASFKEGRLLNSGWPPSPACGPSLRSCLQGTWNGRQSMCHWQLVCPARPSTISPSPKCLRHVGSLLLI